MEIGKIRAALANMGLQEESYEAGIATFVWVRNPDIEAVVLDLSYEPNDVDLHDQLEWAGIDIDVFYAHVEAL